jgi:hypothetical protein
MFDNNFWATVSIYSNMGKEASPGTPYNLANDMLNKLPSDVWSNPNKTFLEPCFANGMFYFLIVERLYNGIANHYPDPKERIKHILTKQVWAYEMNKIPYMLVSKLIEKRFGINSVLDIQPNLCYNNIIDEGLNMKFDVVVMNPPYQDAPKSEKNKGVATGNVIWNKFVDSAIHDWTEQDGYVCAVHPSGWRKPKSARSKYNGMFKMMAQENHMLYLEIHDTKDGMKTFGAGTRYDWYVIAKNKVGITTIKDQNGNTVEVDLKECVWLPNHSFDKIFDLMGDGSGVIYDRGSYGTDKTRSWTSIKETEEFCYPLVHATTKKGNKFWYSSRNDKGHFGISKVIFGDSGINDVIIDAEGNLGMTEHAMALPIDNYEDGLKAKEYLMSDEFKNILN